MSKGSPERKKRLRRARGFIIRMFTQRKIPTLVERLSVAESTLGDSSRQLAGCSVEIDFPFDQPTRCIWRAECKLGSHLETQLNQG